MRPSLRLITPAVLAVALGGACTKQPAPSPSPRPRRTRRSARPRGPIRGRPRIPRVAGRPAREGRAAWVPAQRPVARAEPEAVRSRRDRAGADANGLFKVHRIGSRCCSRSRAEMGKDLLLVQEIAQTTLGAGYGGQARATACCAGSGGTTGAAPRRLVRGGRERHDVAGCGRGQAANVIRSSRCSTSRRTVRTARR